MPKTLRRILRLRELSEETGRAALEAGMRELAQVERVQTAFRDQGCARRKAAYEAVCTGDTEARLLAEVHWELAEGRRRGLEPLRQERERQVNRLRQAFLELRRERRQVELLAEARVAAFEREEARREQQRLDEWFQLQSVRKALRERRGQPNLRSERDS